MDTPLDLNCLLGSYFVTITNIGVANDHEVLYKYKATFCDQHATLLEDNGNNKVQVLCAHSYQTAVSSDLHSFELCKICRVFLGNPYRRTLQ